MKAPRISMLLVLALAGFRGLKSVPRPDTGRGIYPAGTPALQTRLKIPSLLRRPTALRTEVRAP